MSAPDAWDTLILHPVEFCISLIVSPPAHFSQAGSPKQPSVTVLTFANNHADGFRGHDDGVVNLTRT